MRRCNKGYYMVPETDFRRRPNGDLYATYNRCREVAYNRLVLNDHNPRMQSPSMQNNTHLQTTLIIQQRRPRRPLSSANPIGAVYFF